MNDRSGAERTGVADPLLTTAGFTCVPGLQRLPTFASTHEIPAIGHEQPVGVAPMQTFSGLLQSQTGRMAYGSISVCARKHRMVV
jgi:hypothetical protein